MESIKSIVRDSRTINALAWFLFILPTVFFITLVLCVILSLCLYSDPTTVINNLLSKEIHFAVSLSLTTSLVSTLLCVIVSIPTGYILARKRGIFVSIMDMLVDMPIAFPPLVAGVGLLILLGPVLGIYLAKVGLKFVFTTQGIIISQFFVAAPFSIKMMKSTFQEIDSRYEIVARTLKARRFGAFFRVTLPLAREGIIGMISLTWARILGEFGATMMLVGATRFKTETLPNALYLNMTDGNLDMVLATSVVFLIVGFSMLTIYKISLMIGFEKRK
jgi:molybdate transport system permease protein